MSLNNRIVSIVDDDPYIIFFMKPYKVFQVLEYLLLQILSLALEHFQVNDYAYVLVLSDLNAWLEWHGITKKDKGFESLRKNDTNECVHNR